MEGEGQEPSTVDRCPGPAVDVEAQLQDGRSGRAVLRGQEEGLVHPRSAPAPNHLACP